jgi:hypothetical protein
MAKKKAAAKKPKATKPSKKKPGSKLSARGEQVIAHVLNSIAFKSHSKEGDLESIAASLEIAVGRLRGVLLKLSELGYATVEGSAEFVYPTVRTLRQQQHGLSIADAEKLLRKLRR